MTDTAGAIGHTPTMSSSTVPTFSTVPLRVEMVPPTASSVPTVPLLQTVSQVSAAVSAASQTASEVSPTVSQVSRKKSRVWPTPPTAEYGRRQKRIIACAQGEYWQPCTLPSVTDWDWRAYYMELKLWQSIFTCLPSLFPGCNPFDHQGGSPGYGHFSNKNDADWTENLLWRLKRDTCSCVDKPAS